MFANNPSIADIAAVTNRDGDGWGGGNGWWVLIILFALFGWGGNRYGQNGTQGDYALATDFATLERKMDGINSGLCDGFYAMNTNFGTLNNTLGQGFSGINAAINAQGYESRLATQNLGAQLAQCCCETQQNINANTQQGILNTNAIQQQLSQCCCDQEKQAMETRFQAQQNNCTTLQAIDKVGDRIIDYMSNQETQRLRDENQALRLSASQSAQNQYIVNTLRPMPVPAYGSCNPWAGSCNTFNGCCC